MRISLLILLILFSVPVQAQDRPSDCTRTIDSLRTQIAIEEAEVRRADHQAELFAQTVAEVFRGESSTPKHVTLAALVPYITVGAEGQSHSDASVYGGIGLQYSVGAFGIDCAARYQYFPPQDTMLQHWRTVFYGGLKIFLF